MKFVFQDGTGWVEVDGFGNVIGHITNADHAVLLQQGIIQHAHYWLYTHTDWGHLVSNTNHVHDLIQFAKVSSQFVLSALGVN